MTDIEPKNRNLFDDEAILAEIELFTSEIRNILPELDPGLAVNVIHEHVDEPKIEKSDDIWNNAVGGKTLTPSDIELSIDHRIQVDTAELFGQLRETLFHESYHAARGYSFELRDLSLLDVALEEGLATKFEMIHADSEPWYGIYRSKETMLETLREVTRADSLGPPDGAAWQKWKFYDPETDKYWTLYRVGTFIIDEVLTRNPDLTIEGLVSMERKDIFALSGPNCVLTGRSQTRSSDV